MLLLRNGAGREMHGNSSEQHAQTDDQQETQQDDEGDRAARRNQISTGSSTTAATISQRWTRQLVDHHMPYPQSSSASRRTNTRSCGSQRCPPSERTSTLSTAMPS